MTWSPEIFWSDLTSFKKAAISRDWRERQSLSHEQFEFEFEFEELGDEEEGDEDDEEENEDEEERGGEVQAGFVDFFWELPIDASSSAESKANLLSFCCADCVDWADWLLWSRTCCSAVEASHPVNLKVWKRKINKIK